ncbi:cytochrome c oxidase subunit 3 [Crocinitomix algicola]|uniref:cytochrome c oxidase subunit 3 n=1 Tax=Crocinitomix algicola TaxID=1740263 RepID=UPI000872EF6D|nr:cytochrome c oxidase subunit 3 [Crocinitomix algicola]
MEKGKLTPAEINAKMKKNLLWIFIFAVIMIFAGLTSGYIVSQGGNFWVAIKMPSSFTISTLLIIASSISLYISSRAIKKDNQKLSNIGLGLAFVLGIGFAVFQFLGWKQLTENGNKVVADIINTRGKYGKYFTLLGEGKEITYDNGNFYHKGQQVSSTYLEEMKNFARVIYNEDKTGAKTYKFTNYGTAFTLRYDNQILTYVNDQLKLNNEPLSEIQQGRLWYFADNIVNDRGDFMMKGKYGEDFSIYYNKEELEYTNRTFYYKGAPLSALNQDKLNSQRNTASSYIYAFTGVHLLHWLGGIISLLVMFISGLRMKYSKENYLGITLGSIYWHFLGILWLFLYAFLILIH